eukprot:2592996-Rhodomonas_salina.2
MIGTEPGYRRGRAEDSEQAYCAVLRPGLTAAGCDGLCSTELAYGGYVGGGHGSTEQGYGGGR